MNNVRCNHGGHGAHGEKLLVSSVFSVISVVNVFLVSALAVCLLSPVASLAADTAAAERELDGEIRALILKTGGDKIGEQIGAQMLQSLKQRTRGAATTDEQREQVDRMFEELTQIIRKADLVGMIAQVYKKHFTVEEIRGLNAFYETELGQKIIRVLPELTLDCFEAGQIWGMRVTDDLIRRYDPDKQWLDK